MVAAGLARLSAAIVALNERVAGTPVEERLTEVTATDDFVVLRGGAPYLVAANVVAAYAGGSPAATEPAAFAEGQWTADATATPGEISFNLTDLPNSGGSDFTALQYRTGTGAAIDFVGTGTGVRVVTAGLTAGAAADLQVRAVNAVGAGAWSDIKNRTPLAAGGGAGGTITVSRNTGADLALGESATYRNGGGTGAGYWEPGNGSGRMLWRPGAGFNAANIPGVVTAATLRIYMSEQFGASTVTAYSNLRAWSESWNSPSWANWAEDTPWATAGGSGAADRSASAIGSEATPATNGVWIEIELDPAVVEGWRQAGGIGACGVQLNGVNDQYSTYITDVGTDGLRPELVVTYS